MNPRQELRKAAELIIKLATTSDPGPKLDIQQQLVELIPTWIEADDDDDDDEFYPTCSDGCC